MPLTMLAGGTRINPQDAGSCRSQQLAIRFFAGYVPGAGGVAVSDFSATRQPVLIQQCEVLAILDAAGRAGGN